ncbi:MAG: hypothetical protein CL565_05045 [Alphaproteobacteria bacterium]|nr:hypothetical protein [Alphaproteobacteria bacterium]|tara:strand:- start:939 stop:1250 length:312 start_codon:yes stop_codon:yes gene_type:complete
MQLQKEFACNNYFLHAKDGENVSILLHRSIKNPCKYALKHHNWKKLKSYRDYQIMSRIYNLASKIKEKNPLRGLRMKCLDEIDFDYSYTTVEQASINAPKNEM